MSFAAGSEPPGSPPLEHHERLITRNFLTLGGGELVARIIGFGATVFAARQLGAEAYGIIGFALTVTLYLATLADLGIEQLGPREVSDRHHGHVPLDDMVSSVLLVRFGLSILLAAALAAAGLLWRTQPEGNVIAVYSLALLAVGASAKWVHIGLDRNGTASTSRLIAESVKLILVVGLVRDAGDFFIVPIAFVAGDLLGSLWLLAGLRQANIHLHARIDRALVRTVLGHARPLLLTAILGMLLYNADVVMLRIFRDRTEVGLYLVAYTLINFLGVLGGVLTSSVMPTFRRLRHDRAQRDNVYFTAMARALAIGLPLAVGGSLLAGPLIITGFGSAYQASVPALQVLIWTFPLLLLRSVEQGALIAAGDQHRMVQITAIAAATNVLLNLYAIPRYGFVGAALVTLFAETVRYLLTRRFASGAGFPLAPPARLWRPLLASGVMAAALLATHTHDSLLGLPLGAVAYTIALLAAGGLAWSDGRLHVRL